jgi:tRNA threonylcarbamoyladenosine biosynthesis protein TsaE
MLRVESPEAMRALGARIGAVARPGDILLLEGPFGAGKTTFVQGLAAGLEVEAPVSSPSFVIESQYRGRLVLYHIDLYRLDAIEPALLESLEEHLYGEGVSAVEWAERLPPRAVEDPTRISIDLDGETRRVRVESEHRRILDALGAA